MLYKGWHTSVMCPACDVTPWVRESQQYSWFWEGTTYINLCSCKTLWPKDIKLEICSIHAIMIRKRVQLTITLP